MRRRVGVLFLLLGGFVVGGLLLTLLQRHRGSQALLYSVNNVRELSQFVELSAGAAARPAPTKWDFAPDPRFPPTPVERLRELDIEPVVPAGTVFHPALPPERRLSWIGPLLPTFNQKRQDTAAVFAQLDRTLAWDAGSNAAAGLTPLGVLVSYAAPAVNTPGEPAVTQFVGVGGVGADAPTRPMLPNPFVAFAPPVADSRAGCFRYDGGTPYPAIADGLSQTALIAEVSADLGPWIRGGPATVRTLDVGPDARRAIGAGGQFGGNHLAGGIFGFADHSARVLTARTDKALLHALFTINGAGHDPIPGE